MNEAVRQFIRNRAKHCCEYCRLPQAAATLFTFHIEHIRAKQHGGEDVRSNLCLACPDCNRHKGPNLSGIDPETQELAPLFNPRSDSWEEHFSWKNAFLIGLTERGRTTVQLLKMNDVERVEMRAALQSRGEAVANSRNLPSNTLGDWRNPLGGHVGPSVLGHEAPFAMDANATT